MTGLGLFKQLADFIGGRKKDKVGGESCCRRVIKDIKIGHTGFGVPKKNGACMYENVFAQTCFSKIIFSSF